MLTMPMPETLNKLSENESGQIYETCSFNDGLYFVSQFSAQYPLKKILAALDLDNTVISYRHTLGTDQWFDFDFNQFMSQGLTAPETKEIVLNMYLKMVKMIHPDDVYVVEENTPAVIREMQADRIDTIALTSRGSYLLQETIDQLSRFQINFNQGTYANKEKCLPQSEEGLFTQGMILSAGKHKGECLLTVLEDFGNLPDFIIMWDDKLSNLEKVRDSINAYNAENLKCDPHFCSVQFVGIRYSKLDYLVNNVDPQVIDLQKQYFQRILSDEHALAIVKSEQKKTRQHFVGIDFQPQNDKVVLSCHKYEAYDKLLGLCSELNMHEQTGAVKNIQGKKKLTRQFHFTVKQFEPLFHLLSQHGLIEPSQFTQLDPIFNIPQRVITPLLESCKNRVVAKPLDGIFRVPTNDGIDAHNSLSSSM